LLISDPLSDRLELHLLALKKNSFEGTIEVLGVSFFYVICQLCNRNVSDSGSSWWKSVGKSSNENERPSRSGAAVQRQHGSERTMIYELRIYHCISGRLPALLKRFDTITLKIWEKHGIKQAGFWTVGIGESNQDLYYLLAWESLADREKKWNAFQADPAWTSARAETEKDGPIVASVNNQILLPTAFSAVK
jgi:hypothetical protein